MTPSTLLGAKQLLRHRMVALVSLVTVLRVRVVVMCAALCTCGAGVGCDAALPVCVCCKIARTYASEAMRRARPHPLLETARVTRRCTGLFDGCARYNNHTPPARPFDAGTRRFEAPHANLLTWRFDCGCNACFAPQSLLTRVRLMLCAALNSCLGPTGWCSGRWSVVSRLLGTSAGGVRCCARGA
jgi:hypothetical protein